MKTTFIKFKLLATFCLLFSTGASFAQDSIVIQGELQNNSKYAKVVVNKFGIGSFPIAAFPIENNKFSITAPIDIEPGVYRLQYSQTANEYVDVIINGKEKNITFSINVLNEPNNRKPVFTQSKENINWYGYQNQSQLLLQKIASLQQTVANYPNTTDKIIKELEKALKLEQANYLKQEATFIKNNTTSWAALLVKNKPYYFTNPKDDWRLQAFDVKERFWQGIETNRTELINTPLYTEHILEYLKYYMNPEMQFGEEEMNSGFMKSVDTIMQRFGSNATTKEFALKYLQLGFKEIGNEKVLQYIDEKYKKEIEQCSDNSGEKEAFEKRMAGYAAMKEGMQAPDIAFTNKTTLYEIKSERTIVVFWASWCPHCMEELPKLEEWAKANPETKVVAISLDDEKSAYETAITKFPSIFHDTDLKRWKGKAVSDYYVYGTPTFVVLDKDKKIIQKFSSFEQLKTVGEKNK